MRTLIRHLIALLLFTFVCKVVFEAQDGQEKNAVPKSLLLSSLEPGQPLPRKIDTKPILAAFRKDNSR